MSDGIHDDVEAEREVLMENGVAFKLHGSDEHISADEIDGGLLSSDTAVESMEGISKATSDAIVISPRPATSLSNGYSTSYSSSGIGTCSSLGAESEPGNGTDLAGFVDDLIKVGSAVRDVVFDDDAVATADGTMHATQKGFSRSRSACEEQRSGERMADIAEVLEETAMPIDQPAAEAAGRKEDEERDEEEEEEAAEVDDPNPGVTFRACMRQKVELLPVPVAVKDYLLFYRI
jgi:hypothetical protein